MSEDVTAFIDELRREDAAAKTITNYASDLAVFSRWFAETTSEEFSARAVNPTDVRDYKAHLQAVQGARPATVNRRLAALRRFFTWALAAGKATEDPTRLVKGAKSAPRGPRSIPKRDVDRLVRMAEKDTSSGAGKRNLAIITTLRHTGLRVGELCGLKTRYVDISERKGAVRVWGKGGRYRVVPLNLDARRAIADYLAVRPLATSDHLFIGQRGEALKPQGVELIVAKYARLAGLEDVTPHVLRHSLARHMLDAGVDLVTVSTLLGHQRLETTAIYTRPTEHDLEAAVDRLGTHEGAR